MAPLAGWYDDPRDASRLRYWDGVAWTEHLTVKAPASAQPTHPQQPGYPEQPAAPARPIAPQGQVPPAQWTYPGAPPARDQQWQYGGAPPQQAWPQAPGQPGAAAKAGPTTPDGVPITTWIKRFLAKLLDWIIVAIGSLPITGYILYRYYEAVTDQLSSSSGSTFMPSSAVIRWEVPLFAVFLVLEVIYETFSLHRWGATPGMRAMEISVRRWDAPGQLPWVTVARRVVVMYGIAALNLLPVLSVIAFLLATLNYLWPLWDKRRQALHDKFADTVVVEGPRQRVSSGSSATARNSSAK